MLSGAWMQFQEKGQKKEAGLRWGQETTYSTRAKGKKHIPGHGWLPRCLAELGWKKHKGTKLILGQVFTCWWFVQTVVATSQARFYKAHCSVIGFLNHVLESSQMILTQEMALCDANYCIHPCGAGNTKLGLINRSLGSRPTLVSSWFSGLGAGNFPTPPPEPPKPRCEANTCFRGVRCTDTVDGFQCGPCPEGFTGNGVTCTDIDEVKYSFYF